MAVSLLRAEDGSICFLSYKQIACLSTKWAAISVRPQPSRRQVETMFEIEFPCFRLR